MKRFKKAAAVFLCLVLTAGCVGAFSACKRDVNKAYEVVLITDGASVTDKGYNQSAWEGVQAYAEESGKSCRYYQPYLDDSGKLSEDTIAQYVDLAIQNGAKQIVLPGKAFEFAAGELLSRYSEVQFVLADAFPRGLNDNQKRTVDNVMCVEFNHYEAGFLAGYTSVLKGNTKLGFFGEADNDASADYGEGFVAGAGYAADEGGIPVYMDHAVFNDAALDYDYAFTVKAEYIKREDAKKDTFKVKVVDGIGSGVYTDGENVTVTANPAPEGKVFDHWEVKSDTEGVKDKKVNISSKKDASMNLLVGDCDCTITAVWRDEKTVKISIDAKDLVTGVDEITYYAPVNSEYWVEAPAAPSGRVFDHWECADENAVMDTRAKGTTVNVGESDIQLTPVYVASVLPTFNVVVENGSGTGSYLTGDTVRVVAKEPEEGYMFYKWENIDNQGLPTGIAMKNEYCYHTEFEMVDRFASVVEKMFDDGTQVVFAGGCNVSDSVFTATQKYDYPVYGFGCGIDEGGKGTCLASVINDYGAAVKQCLADFKGGETFEANVGNGCIYVTGVSADQKNESEYDARYAAVYAALAQGKDLKTSGTYKCLTVNKWIK